jgi:hypothetical protein
VSSRKQSSAFLLLILAQAVHSIEEYVAKLYDVFAPARLVSSLLSDDLAFGFLIGNALLVGLGFLCWVFPVRQEWRSARGVVWFWSILELVNGVNHCVLALWSGGYFPGALTAPLLILLAVWNVRRLRQQTRSRRAAGAKS